MAIHLTYTAVYEEVEDGWVQGRLVEMPGVITVAPTREEAETMIRDALGEYLASHCHDAVAAPPGAETELIKLTIAT